MTLVLFLHPFKVFSPSFFLPNYIKAKIDFPSIQILNLVSKNRFSIHSSFKFSYHLYSTKPLLNLLLFYLVGLLLGCKMAKVLIILLGLLFICFSEISEAEYLKYKDRTQPLNVRIKDLLGRMTLEEKIGQMVQIERVNASAEVMKKYFIGKYLLLSFNSLLFLRNI